MITQDLYEKVLMKPARDSGDSLYVISGYASAAFAGKHLDDIIHLEDVLKLKKRPAIYLLIGMFPKINNLRNNHLAFKQLSTEDYPATFECRYITKPPSVHIKAYSWYKNDSPFCGYIGSANYTRNGFITPQLEAITEGGPLLIRKYFDMLWENAIDCRDLEADDLVENALKASNKPTSTIPTVAPTGYEGLPYRALTLLSTRGTSKGKVHNGGGGLNWGHPSPSGRVRGNLNEAYIPVPMSIARTDFFPPMKEYFTVVTDNDKSLICVREQPKKRGGEDGAAIATPLNNGELGLYFRHRLGLSSEAFITKQNLDNYGRTDVVFYKIDEETYYMDFSVSP
jgi:hypothetical protein